MAEAREDGLAEAYRDAERILATSWVSSVGFAVKVGGGLVAVGTPLSGALHILEKFTMPVFVGMVLISAGAVIVAFGVAELHRHAERSHALRLILQRRRHYEALLSAAHAEKQSLENELMRYRAENEMLRSHALYMRQAEGAESSED